MDKAGILCEKDRTLMQEFSRRSLKHMPEHSAFSLIRSFFSSYMEANVNKETDKDALIIREAAAAFEAGRPVCDLDLESIFEKTKEIDKTFLRNLIIPRFTISIRYGDIVDIRIRRIWRVSKTVYALLKNWPDGTAFSDAVKKAYSGDRFKSIIVEILHLYDFETRMLADSIHSPFKKAIKGYLETLYTAMEETKEELGTIYAGKIYGEIVHV